MQVMALVLHLLLMGLLLIPRGARGRYDIRTPLQLLLTLVLLLLLVLVLGP
jgi:hypothetical protein